MLAGRVLYGVYGLFAGVFRTARRNVYSPFCLLNLAFGFKFLFAGGVPSHSLPLPTTLSVAPFTCSSFMWHLYTAEMLVDEQRASVDPVENLGRSASLFGVPPVLQSDSEEKSSV
jgi:hypothetical protein